LLKRCYSEFASAGRPKWQLQQIRHQSTALIHAEQLALHLFQQHRSALKQAEIRN